MNDNFYTNGLDNSREKSVHSGGALLLCGHYEDHWTNRRHRHRQEYGSQPAGRVGGGGNRRRPTGPRRCGSGHPCAGRISDLFGQVVLNADGSLNRQTMRELVFNDAGKRQQLEAILHPAIKDLALERLAQARQAGAAVAVYMAPLLIEVNATDRVDEIWVVTVRPEIQLERLTARDNCSREAARRIIAAQMPLAEKEQFGVVVIDNSENLDMTRQQVVTAWQQRIAV